MSFVMFNAWIWGWNSTLCDISTQFLFSLFLFASSTLAHSFLFFFYKFIYLFVCFLFLAVLGLCCCVWAFLVAVSGGYSLLQYAGISLSWFLLLRSMGSRHMGFSSCGTQAQELWLAGSRAQAQ